MERTIRCPHCEVTWQVESPDDGFGYDRQSLKAATAEIGEHMRTVHADLAVAERAESYTRSPFGWPGT